MNTQEKYKYKKRALSNQNTFGHPKEDKSGNSQGPLEFSSVFSHCFEPLMHVIVLHLNPLL